MRYAMLCLGLGCAIAHAGCAETAIDRYTAVAHEPTVEQVDLLQQNVHVQFPAAVRTTGEAIHYLLQPSGYQLVTTEEQAAVTQFLAQPLPLAHRELGPLTLHDALHVITGEYLQLVIDPLHRLMTFHLHPDIALLYDIPMQKERHHE